MAFGFICFNVRCVLHEVLHPRSVLHRRYLFYRADPTFVRTRLFFELVRRFVYFIVGIAFLSYALHRLTGNEYMFAVRQEKVSLFLQHLESALSSMTSFGGDPLIYTNDLGSLFHFFCSLFAFTLLVAFANLIISGMSSSGSATENQATSRKGRLESSNGLNTKNDVAALVELVIEDYLEISSIQIKPESDLIRDLGADSLDIVELHLKLEQAFECGAIQPSAIDGKTKVRELTDFFWKLVQKETLEKDILLADEG